jgi:transcriptional regulator with XRE-family HTH domain
MQDAKEILRLEFVKIYNKSKLTQLKFAEKVGCTTQHIGQLKSGVSPVTFKTLSKYANIFNQVVNISLSPIKKIALVTIILLSFSCASPELEHEKAVLDSLGIEYNNKYYTN